MRNPPYPSLHLARTKIDEAEQAYDTEMARLFPPGTLVRVNHCRGTYFAEVVGRDSGNRRLILSNNATGKRTYAYPSLRVGIDDNSPPCVVVEG